MLYLLLLMTSLYYSWRYSKTSVDPDWAMFNFEGFTNSWYGKDYVDCKMPSIHLLYWAIAKVVGPNIGRVKFAYHMLIGLPALGIYALTGSFAAAMVYLVLVQSGWLLAFHGNVGQVPAALLTFALLSNNGWVVAVLGLWAIAFEPKLVFSFSFLMVARGMVLPLAIGVGLAVALALVLYQFYPKVWAWLWEANITIPKRMTQRRKKYLEWKAALPNNTSTGLVYFLPWLAAAMYFKPDLVYWMPVLIYIALLCVGIMVHPNHLIPIVPWIVAAGLPGELVAILAASDWLSSGLYLGDIWLRFYPGLYTWNEAARLCGEYVRYLGGTLWCADLHSGVYIHARKPVQFGMAEQVEIREVAHERREEMVKEWKYCPPDFVVTGPEMAIQYNASGYKLVGENSLMKVYKIRGAK